jgi:hypothetical protein
MYQAWLVEVEQDILDGGKAPDAAGGQSPVAKMERMEKAGKLLDLFASTLVTHDGEVLTHDGEVLTYADDQTLEKIAVILDGGKPPDAAGGLPQGGQPPTEQPDLSNGKEVPWNPSDPDYISATAAVAHVKGTDKNFDHRGLNKVLTYDGPMRYMRNPGKKEKGPGSVQRKVHKGDLETWCHGLKRAPSTKARPGGEKRTARTHSEDKLYEKGFAEGHQAGYQQGYTEVKERKGYSCQPSFNDDPADSYAHGQYEGWIAGYKKGRQDSQAGKPEKHGPRD